jgi:hypothetical protein
MDGTTMKKTLLNIEDFALAVGRHKMTVQGWINEGKISRPALIGTRIWLERARKDLAQSLDTRRQNISTNPRSIDEPDETSRRLQAAHTAIAEAKAALSHHSMLVASGKIVHVDEFKRDCAKELAQLNQDREFFLMNVLAKGLSATFDLDWRLASAEIRKHYRQFQTEASTKALAEAEAD